MTMDKLEAPLRRRESGAWLEVVARSVEIKAGIVASDEREAGRRAVLNFGHTVAHAVETVRGYEALHGEAVAMGLVAEARLGEAAGITQTGIAGMIRAAIHAFGLPTDLEPGETDAVIRAMQFDKKARDGTVRFALLETLGSPARDRSGNWTFELPEEAVRAVLPR